MPGDHPVPASVDLEVERLNEAWTELQAAAVEQIPRLAAALGVLAGGAGGDAPRNTP